MKVLQLSDKILTIDGFLNPSECEEYIAMSEKIGYEAAKLDSKKVVTEVRNNQRAFYESQELASLLFERSAPYLPDQIGSRILVGLNELFRFYKYLPGHQFKKHQDGSFIRNKTEVSAMTFMIYLNDGCVGGETTFLEHQIAPKTGKALVFYHKLLHEGSEVKEGVKYVLRTDVMYRTKEV